MRWKLEKITTKKAPRIPVRGFPAVISVVAALIELPVVSQFGRGFVSVAVGLFFPGFDENTALILLGGMHRNVHIVTGGVFAVIDDFPANAVEQ